MEQTLGQRLEELVWTYSSMARMHVVHKDLAGTELEKIAEKLDVRCTLLSTISLFRRPHALRSVPIDTSVF